MVHVSLPNYALFTFQIAKKFRQKEKFWYEFFHICGGRVRGKSERGLHRMKGPVRDVERSILIFEEHSGERWKANKKMEDRATVKIEGNYQLMR